MNNRATMYKLLVVASAIAIAACSGDKDQPVAVRPAQVQPTMAPQPVVAPAPKSAKGSDDDEDKDDDDKDSQAGKPAKKDAKKGDKNDSDWVPAEFKTGGARWKDTGVYLDGRPVGFLSWGELPITLKPVWVRSKITTNIRPNSHDPGWRWGQQRYYRFTDYLKAVGVDINKVKELHLYGPKFSNSVVATRKDLQSPAGKDFLFRFGASVGGKAIPKVPENFGEGHAPDKVAALMVYIEKEPPKLVPDVGFVLGNDTQYGVPYFGDPIRGGIRVYLNDRLATVIKRQDLDPSKTTKNAAGDPTWKLTDFLTAHGVDTSKVAEMWVIRGERRTEKLTREEIDAISFSASAQAKGGVILGEKGLRANALALHTRALKPDELPYITPDDE